MGKDRPIDTIIFDVGNVLVHFGWKKYLDAFGFAPEVRETVAAATFLSPQWDEMDKSLLPDREYLRAFIQNAPQYQREIQMVYEDCGDCIHTYDYAVPFVKRFKEEGFHLYILSNYSRYLFHKTAHKMPFRAYMDGEIFSFQTGQIKPDPEIYQSLLGRYSIHPRRALFLDDRPENLETASRMRIHTLQFSTYTETMEKLHGAGILQDV